MKYREEQGWDENVMSNITLELTMVFMGLKDTNQGTKTEQTIGNTSIIVEEQCVVEIAAKDELSQPEWEE